MVQGLMPATDRLSVLGHDMQIHLSAAQTAGALTVFEQSSPPGSSIPPHYHEREHETFYVLSGEVQFIAGDKARIERSGGVLFVPPRMRHGLRVVGSEPARLLVYVTPGGIELMFQELARLPAGPADMATVRAVCAPYGNVFE